MTSVQLAPSSSASRSISHVFPHPSNALFEERNVSSRPQRAHRSERKTGASSRSSDSTDSTDHRLLDSPLAHPFASLALCPLAKWCVAVELQATRFGRPDADLALPCLSRAVAPVACSSCQPRPHATTLSSPSVSPNLASGRPCSCLSLVDYNRVFDPVVCLCVSL